MQDLKNTSVKSSKPNLKNKTSPSKKLVLFTNISSMVLTIVSMFAIFVAMNIQDVKRNVQENWNTTVVYFVLLFILGMFLTFSIISLVKKRFKLLSILSTIPVIATLITTTEESILSWGYYKSTYYYDSYQYYNKYEYYNNYEVVDAYNTFWITCVFVILFICLIPVIVAIIKNIINNCHKSVSYREKCYKRVAKIHSYLERGIITEEEYEKTKNDILKNVQ